jgi:lysozyme family protein
MDIFDYSFELVLEFEGGYSNSPHDGGGRTYLGVSERAHPELWRDGKPTREQAMTLYRDHYWDRCRCDKMPGSIAVPVFDMAVNAGVSRSVKTLQSALGTVLVDSLIGPETLDAVNHPNIDRRVVVCDFTTYRLHHYASLQNYSHYWKGWTRRAVHVAMNAMLIE